MSNPQNTPGGGGVDTSAVCGHFKYAADDRRIAALGFGVPALDLVALGCAVLPLERGLKRPHGMLPLGGVHNASSDPRQVRYWWEIEDQFANVGVRTGRLPFGGRQIVVADLDTKNGHDGPAAFRAFLAENRLSLPPGHPVARTPSGGWHLWLGWPASWGPCPDRQSILGGVDVKGDAGYVVVPPSYLRVMPDGRDGSRIEPIPVPYRWQSGCPCRLPDAPPWFARWIATAPAAGRPQGTASSSGDGIDAEQIIARGAEPGSRNDTLHRLACSRYRRYGTGPAGAAAVLDDVRTAWLAGDTAGLPWGEVLTLVASARRYIEGQQQAERRAYAAWLGRGRS